MTDEVLIVEESSVRYPVVEKVSETRRYKIRTGPPVFAVVRW